MAQKTVGASPKVIVTTIVSGLIGVLIAVLNAVSANSDLLGSLPPMVQGLILVLIPPVVTWLAGYQAPPGTVVNDGTAPDSSRKVV